MNPKNFISKFCNLEINSTMKPLEDHGGPWFFLVILTMYVRDLVLFQLMTSTSIDSFGFTFIDYIDMNFGLVLIIFFHYMIRQNGHFLNTNLCSSRGSN
jgi:hypothetical protein